MICDDIKSRRGMFEISHDALFQNLEAVSKLMSKMIIARAESMYSIGIIEYQAYSPLFRIVSEGENIPSYTIIVNKDEQGNINIKVEEIKL